MATQAKINDPAKAKAYCEAKMAFTTGPVELERAMKNNEVNVIDVRAAEDSHLWPIQSHGHMSQKNIRNHLLDSYYRYPQALL